MITSRFVNETERKIPVILDVDIVVVGAGTAGAFAAISAARQGLKVVMIERFCSIGGNLTVGINSRPSGLIPGGIPSEFWRMAQERAGAGTTFKANIWGKEIEMTAACDPEITKILLMNT